MVENSLHEGIKRWYSRSGDALESQIGGYVVDIVRGDLLIEIQIGNFSAIRDKLRELLKGHHVRLVHPVPERKWIVRVDSKGEQVSRRRSPKRGRVEDVFLELVYIPTLLRNKSLSLEVLLVQSEDILVDDGRGSWRRRGWSLQDRRLIEVAGSVVFSRPEDLLGTLPDDLPPRFTTKDLTDASGLRAHVARKMAYTLRKMGVIERIGKRGRAPLYTVREGMGPTPGP
jgi:hypothetical protein